MAKYISAIKGNRTSNCNGKCINKASKEMIILIKQLYLYITGKNFIVTEKGV